VETITDGFGAKYPELRPKPPHASKIASEAWTSINGAAAWRNAEGREQKVEDWQNTGKGSTLRLHDPSDRGNPLVAYDFRSNQSYSAFVKRQGEGNFVDGNCVYSNNANLTYMGL
jgi:hypothetical protein